MTTTPTTTQPKIVSREQWTEARKAHLAEERRLTHELDELRRQRRELPWVKIDKQYTFDTPAGTKTLAELFEGRSQLIVYHFMFGPDWTEGCDGCSFLADHIDGANLHLPHADVTLIGVSRAPRADFEPFKKRMGWQFTWISSHGSDFNQDFHATLTDEHDHYNYEQTSFRGETPGASVFIKDEQDTIYHTYSTYARGIELLAGAFNYLDLTPKGRNETSTMSWVRHHDRYENASPKDNSCCGDDCCQ